MGINLSESEGCRKATPEVPCRTQGFSHTVVSGIQCRQISQQAPSTCCIMSARYRCMTSSVHICLTVVTGFLIVIFYRNQLQRSSSKEQIELQAKLLNYFLGSNKSNINQKKTLCAREVHRMVFGSLNVQNLHQKMLYTSYMFQ